ncbi:hypothetical protein GH714_019909 [Hevea brasiliensis]|uniref:Uncharacterized protein n=1 Tax=Hevea brasiliensis TaxID=3981 RepID=A0A6A6K9Q9_HEVBR|nr:hypothetical protein GH714_019774 [Hevea brasiliensis]KAF2284209.1 hypothetical protein GH714_019909 [Hevea brasiliensis]
MAKVNQVTHKPRKLLGGAIKAAGRSENEREKETEVEDSDEETNIVAELVRKRNGKDVARSKPSKKKKKVEKVKKKSQVIDVDFIAFALNLPNDGNMIGTFKESKKFEGYNEKEILKADDVRKRSKKGEKK